MHRNRNWTNMLGVPSLLGGAGLLIVMATLVGTSVAAGASALSADTDTSSTATATTVTSSEPTSEPPPSTTAPPTPSTPPTTAPPTTTPPTTTAPPPGEEGCTPGFWKNHPEAFAGTGYSPTTTLGSVFTGLSPAYAALTFDEALSLGGGGLDALLRQAVAALLNASSPDVDYPLSAASVISMTNAAIASGDYEATKDLFDELNNLTAPGFCD